MIIMIVSKLIVWLKNLLSVQGLTDGSGVQEKVNAYDHYLRIDYEKNIKRIL